jgi:hypothetical protein
MKWDGQPFDLCQCIDMDGSPAGDRGPGAWTRSSTAHSSSKVSLRSLGTIMACAKMDCDLRRNSRRRGLRAHVHRRQGRADPVLDRRSGIEAQGPCGNAGRSRWTAWGISSAPTARRLRLGKAA